jgi:protein-S-isoprenylcysteine O-methyltransferase Ste14
VNSWATIARRIRVPLGFIFAVIYFWLARPSVLSLVIGIPIAAVGLFVRAIASGHVRKNEALTTSGPYAHVRNPLYLGSLLAGLGFGIAARSLWIVLLIGAIFALVYLPVIGSEERYLQQQFPEFNRYAEKVPRLLPRRTPFVKSEAAFSWQLYCKHREYNAVLGAILMIAALAAKMVWFT